MYMRLRHWPLDHIGRYLRGLDTLDSHYNRAGYYTGAAGTVPGWGRQRIMWRRTRAVPVQSTISQIENEQALTGVDSFAGIPSEDAVICSLTLVGMRVHQIQSRNLTNVSI